MSIDFLQRRGPFFNGLRTASFWRGSPYSNICHLHQLPGPRIGRFGLRRHCLRLYGWEAKPDEDFGIYPIGSMYGIFTYIYHKNQPDVGK